MAYINPAVEDFNNQRALSQREALRPSYLMSQRDARARAAGTAGNFKSLPPGWNDFFDSLDTAKDNASFDAGRTLQQGVAGDFGAADTGTAPGPRFAPRGGSSALTALGAGTGPAPVTGLGDVIAGDLQGRNLEGAVAKLRELGLMPAYDPSVERAQMGAQKFAAQRAQMTPEDLAAEASGIADTYQPREAFRTARTALDVNPLQQELANKNLAGEGARYWSPWNQGMQADQQRMAIERATAVPQIQGQTSRDVAGIEAGGRTTAAATTAAGRKPDPAALISSVLGNLTSKGAFGVDKNGRPQGPPPEIQQRVSEILMGFLNGESGQTGSTGPSTPNAQGGGGIAVGTKRVINGTPAHWDGYGWVPD